MLPYFLNVINIFAIFVMLSIYFVQNISTGRKHTSSGALYYEVAGYIYIAILAGMVNIMNSINMSDAVFWYGVSLSFGIKSAIFIVVIAGILIGISIYFSPKDDISSNVDRAIKDFNSSLVTIKSRQAEIDTLVKEYIGKVDREVSEKNISERIKGLIASRTDEITENIQHLSDKTAIIAEQLTKIRDKKTKENIATIRRNPASEGSGSDNI